VLVGVTFAEVKDWREVWGRHKCTNRTSQNIQYLSGSSEPLQTSLLLIVKLGIDAVAHLGTWWIVHQF
jgi:hypothetical protein